MLYDGPIENKSDDKLKRAELANKLAKAICSRSNSESFVIGIDGKWGSGKTSFINLILRNLCPCQFIIYKFNPWILGSHENLVKSFMKGLFDAISDDLPVGAQVYRKFQKYTEDITSTNFSIPLWFCSQLFISLGISKNETSLEKRKAGINRCLSCLGRKVIIVIDDLDRLTPEEVKIIVKTIKSIADFRNTTFLIAYDQGIIAKYLDEEKKGFTGKEYLKKIINVNYFIPVPDKNDVSTFLFEKLDVLLNKYFGTNNIDKERWAKIFYGGIDQLIKNMRDAKLLANSLEITLSSLHIPDVNPVDVISVEVIRVFAPETYAEISGHSEVFSGGLFSVRDDHKERTKVADEIIDLSFHEKDERDALKKICHELFPRIASVGYDGGDWQSIWTKEKRVCSYEKFPFYFRFGIPTGSISDSELSLFAEQVKNSNSKTDIDNILKEYDKSKKLTKFLGRLFNYLQNLDSNKVKNLLLALWEIENKVMYQDSDEGGPFFDLSGTIMRLVFNTIKNNIKKDDLLTFIKDIFGLTSDFYGPLKVLSLANAQIEEKKGHEELLIPEANQAEIKKIGLDILNKNQDKLMGHPYMLSLLYLWEKFDGNDVNVKAWIKKNLTSKTIATFLSGATGRSYNSREGAKIIINIESLIHFEIFEKVNLLVIGIPKEKDEIKMTKREKIAVEAFKESNTAGF